MTSVTLLGRKNWVADEAVSHCSGCSAEFGLLTRRHHCRACGGIFCRRCSSMRVDCSRPARTTAERRVRGQARVCDTCFASIREMRWEAEEVTGEAGRTMQGPCIEAPSGVSKSNSTASMDSTLSGTVSSSDSTVASRGDHGSPISSNGSSDSYADNFGAQAGQDDEEQPLRQSDAEPAHGEKVPLQELGALFQGGEAGLPDWSGLDEVPAELWALLDQQETGQLQALYKAIEAQLGQGGGGCLAEVLLHIEGAILDIQFDKAIQEIGSSD